MLTPNIDFKGRIGRALGGLGCLAGSLGFVALPWPWPWWAIVTFLSLLLAGAFMLFEAARGWCALRACGIKTPY